MKGRILGCEFLSPDSPPNLGPNSRVDFYRLVSCQSEKGNNFEYDSTTTGSSKKLVLAEINQGDRAKHSVGRYDFLSCSRSCVSTTDLKIFSFSRG